MKERFDKAKTFVSEHTEQIVVAVLATLAIGATYGLVRSAQSDIQAIEAAPEE